jgi:hypothetical protein
MSTSKRILFFFILPIAGLLCYDPAFLIGSPGLIGVVVLLLVVLGYFLWRGYPNALAFAIFLHGMNAIVRIMMLASTSISKEGVFNFSFTAFGLVGLAISFYLMLRLDEVDIRKTLKH